MVGLKILSMKILTVTARYGVAASMQYLAVQVEKWDIFFEIKFLTNQCVGGLRIAFTVLRGLE